MANILLDICLSDIPKEFIKTSEKNGKKYLKIVVAERKSVDERGNDHAVKIYVPKEQRRDGDKPIYIGNGKSSTFQQNGAQPSSYPTPSYSAPAKANDEGKDDLPFN